MMRTKRTLVLVAALVLALGEATAAQAPAESGYARVTTSTHSRQTVVAIAVHVPAGSALDAEGSGGTAWLLGHLLARRADAAVGAAASVSVEVTRDAALFTVLSLPEDWAEVWDTTESILFGEPAPGQDFGELRESLLADLAFDAGSPVRDFELEAARLVAPPSDPWARPLRGTPGTVPNISAASLQTFARNHYQVSGSTLSIVGPGEWISALQETPQPGPLDPQSAAWTEGSRLDLVQDITNTWLAIAWPVAPGVGRTSLEFFVHLLVEQLDPTPPDPDRFSVDVRIEETPTGPVVLVTAAVFPEAADRWEARILSAAGALAGEAMDDDFLGWRRRRFRTARLLAESRPEVEAERIAQDLMRDGAVRRLSHEIWDLQGADLLAAAQALGTPRILRLGPDLGQGGQPTQDRR